MYNPDILPLKFIFLRQNISYQVRKVMKFGDSTVNRLKATRKQKGGPIPPPLQGFRVKVVIREYN